MRRIRTSALVGLVALALVAAPAAPAEARGGNREVWQARTDQHLPLKFSVQTSQGARFIPHHYMVKMRCLESGQRVLAWIGFVGFEVPIKDGEFDFTLRFGEFIQIKGEFLSRTTASGTLAFEFAQVTPDRQAELCTSGDVPWAGRAKPEVEPLADVHFKATRHADGSVTIERLD
ncbi:MAG TPA: hypothetical protein VEO00_01510 [Actinomycetota bacterium]|nr:hypothetical protein [Actinomycetota bacterium]